MEIIREPESGRTHEIVFRDMERTLEREVPRANAFRRRMQGDVRIELRMNAVEVRTENARSRTAVLAMCAVVLLFPACAFIGSTPKEIRELRTRWTVEVFGADGESLARADLETLTRAGIGRSTAGEAIAFERQMSIDAARQLVRDAREDIQRGLARTARGHSRH